MAKAKTKSSKKTQDSQVREQAQEPNSILARVRPVGVQEDGRMYYISDFGQILTVQRMPYLALRSISKSLEDKDSKIYQLLMSDGDVDDIDLTLMRMREKTVNSGKKCERALVRMKDKGLHTDKISVLRGMIYEKLPMNLNWPLDVILDMNLGLSGMDDWDADIPDAIWLNAIELAVYMTHRQAYLDNNDETQWGLFVSQDCELVWMLVWLTTYGNALYSDMIDAKSEIERAKDRQAQILFMESGLESLRSEIRANQVAFDKKFDSTKRECDALRSENVKLVRENKKLQAKLELMEASMMAAEEEAGQEFELDESVIEDGQTEEFKYDLPESNVLFVGGHLRLQNKLKQLHPKWKFITTRMSYRLLDDNLNSRFVFLYTGHMTHKLFDKVMDSLGTTPMAYVSSQNLNLLHTEMLRAYNEHIQSIQLDA